MGFFDMIISVLKNIFSSSKTVKEQPIIIIQEEEEPKGEVKSMSNEQLPKIAMNEEKFEFMVCGEPEELRPLIRKEMSEKDAIGKYPYIISTDRAIYEIRHSFNSQGQDVTAEYGTSYTMSTKSK